MAAMKWLRKRSLRGAPIVAKTWVKVSSGPGGLAASGAPITTVTFEKRDINIEVELHCYPLKLRGRWLAFAATPYPGFVEEKGYRRVLCSSATTKRGVYRQLSAAVGEFYERHPNIGDGVHQLREDENGKWQSVHPISGEPLERLYGGAAGGSMAASSPRVLEI